ncbi:hypothetical protein LGT39_02815 [Demequina sp. TTPB684]|uniref:hypothetical protein n=1 Tax=unclassified Demequina TaxID=2620311 RepID=UPI001CF26BA4|nr:MULTISPECIES: hypothetical protein [unclassified Demequina]MCB2411780.1 hypothetical protein [Demequina sp. TTPB684]UPU89009.1 hypothetical protein LGT36_003545 [Demequina sp. TMPB413]
MDVTLAAVLITAIVSISGSWLVARTSARTSARQVEQQEREADRQRIKDLEDRDAMWEQRCNVLWAAREADALIKRAQGDFIDILEDHIWKEKPPPPPPRPQFL